MTFRPYPFQRRGVRQIHQFGGRALLADEQGLGKTIQALWYLQRHPECLPAVVVCPATLKHNWEEEARKFFGFQARVLRGTRPGRVDREESELVVVNYDILSAWLPRLKDARFRTVILDECHMLGNQRTARTRAARGLCRKSPHVLGLSGTPLVNRPAELWPVLNMIRPDLFPSFRPYAFDFCDPKQTPWGWDYRGSSNLRDLHRKLANNLMIRRLKADVLQELPEKVRCVLPLELEQKARTEYQRAAVNFRAWLRDRSPARLLAAERAEGLSRLNYLKQLIGQLKLAQVIQWVEDYLSGSDSKLILFAVHRNVLHTLADRFRGRCVLIDGDTPVTKRGDAVRRFQENKSTRLFLGNIRAAGAGITLTASSTVAFAELGWTPGEHSQAEARPHRIGQKDSVTCYYLLARDTLEVGLARILDYKQKVISRAIDGDADTNQMDVHAQLMEEIRNEGS